MPRPKVRPATFILPRTGARLRGFVNLGRSDRSHENGNHVDDEEHRPLLDDSSSDDEEASIASSQRRRRAIQPVSRWSRLSDRVQETMWATCSNVIEFATSELGQGVLKCSLAYLLGSLATFLPFIARFLGHQDGKHVVATITVYFHPARSAGSMFKALICAFLAFLYAAFVSITSMCVAMLFENLNMLPLGHAVVLLFFCGGGLGFVGWTKQRLSDPLVNVACSLASLSLITVLTKEGDVQRGSLSFAKISQTLKMLILGVSATMAISFLLFPISARKKLRANMVTLTGTLATLLAGITESFLSGSEADMEDAKFLQALAENKRAYGQLDQLVKEAKLEHYVVGTEREYRLEKRLARCLQDINQNMGGLQSAAALQFQILKQAQNLQVSARSRSSFARKSSMVSSPGAWSALEFAPTLTSMDERVNDGSALEQDYGFTYSPQRMFDIFIEHLGPSMRSLAFTLKEIFDDLPFGPGPDYNVSFNSKYRTSLDRALSLYRVAREEALASVYREKDFAKISSPAAEADLEEVSASCGHFSFSLMEFGEQLKDLLSILDELQLETEERPYGRSWSWLKFWQYLCSGGRSASRIVDTVIERPVIRKRPTLEQGLVQDKQAQRRLGYRIWKSLAFFRRDETKFALKVGVGAALYALPAFIPSTRPAFSRWRGEWGLLSYMLVCSMTIGASNTTGFARFLGTCLGAGCAVVAWYITAGNVFGLAFLGWVMAFGTAYIILVRKQGPMGRFIMLTYNLSVLYAYSLTVNDDDNDDDEGGPNPIITEIAIHRVVAVLTGCIWGIIVTRMIWPISARKKLKHGLSLLWLQMSLIWKRDPLSTMVDGRPASGYLTARERLQLERYLSRLEGLQVAAKSEFELKSPFPEAAYRNLLRRTRIMLNAFYAMNMQILKSMEASEGEVSLLQYTTQERQQLSSRISHLLSVLASSMKLEYPLIEALPSIEHSRDRLLMRIYHFRRDADMAKRTTDADYALLYAYVLVTGQLGSEIVEIIGEISRLFGVLRDDVIELQ